MSDIKINPEFRDLIPKLSQDEMAALEASILEEGCRDSIVLWNDTIVDGHNRFEICTKHSVKFNTIQKDFQNSDDVKVWMINNQLGRRNLTEFVRYELIQAKEEVFKKKGREAMSELGSNGGRGNKKGLSIIDKPFTENNNEKQHNTQKEIAKDLGWSQGKVAMAQQVSKKADDLTKEKLRAGELSINQVYQEVKKKEKKDQRQRKIQEVREKIEAENVITPNKKYHVIAIDPPWAYSEKGGFSSEQYDSKSNRGAVDYPTMSVAEISKIELPDADDCVVFLWTTHAFLRDSFQILEGWGFNYKATLVWDKVKMGIGRTVRMQVEFCLIATKGSPIINGSSERDIISEPRREHSRKPEAFYEMVERMCLGNKLDYFSRQNRENWDHYGAEQGQF